MTLFGRLAPSLVVVSTAQTAVRHLLGDERKMVLPSPLLHTEGMDGWMDL